MGQGDALREVLREAQRQGFLGPGDLGTHLDHAAELGDVVDELLGSSLPKSSDDLRLLDLGTGGGVPGLALALRWQSAQIWLLEGSTRRAAFLRRAVGSLGLGDRVAVLAERAEVAGRGSLRGDLDLVTSRAFGRPAVVAECGAPFLRPGGLLVVSEPPKGEGAATRWPEEGLAQLGLRSSPSGGSSPRFQVLCQQELCPDRFPRRVGVPGKRPLF